MKWTKEQQEAIELRNKNILVSAAAGSGKTAVLVERIKQLIIKDQVPLDRMLVVTFSNAAASEMREKIVAAITKEIENCAFEDAASKSSKFLREQLNIIHKANISTFHAFSMEVIRRYFYLINIEPNFKICDEAQKIILQAEAMDQLFSEKFQSVDQDFLRFLHQYAMTKNENHVRDMIYETHNFIQSIPDSFQWLRHHIESLNCSKDEFLKSPAFIAIKEDIAKLLNSSRNYFLKVREILDLQGISSLIPKCDLEINAVEQALQVFANGSFDDFAAIMQTIGFQTYRCAKEEKEAYEEIKEEAATLREQGKAAINRIKSTYLFRTIEEYVAELNQTYEDALCLYTLTEEFDKRYKEKKESKGLIDFNDIEHYALEILSHEEAAREYRNKFEHIFIDEYQDSNIVQETLINRITRENNLFMVGDVKQSIYKFRLAEPEIFINKYERFKLNESSCSMKLDLNRNFRSKGCVICAVNDIFSRIMKKELSGLAYDEEAALYKGVAYEGELDYPVEFHLTDDRQIEEMEIDEEIKDMKKAELEAFTAVQIIKDALGRPIYDAKKDVTRELSYRDMVILLRSAKDTAGIYYEALMKEGIPAFVDNSDGYFDTLEIEVFLNLLRIIDNKKQDIPFLSILRSSIFGFSIEELIEIRIQKSRAAYYEAFESYAAENLDTESENEWRDFALQNKCRSVLEQISVWKKEASFMPLEDFLWKLIRDTGYYDYIGAIAGGIQRQANLRALIDKAVQFQNSQMKGLFSFIQYIEAIKKRKVAMGQVKLLGENDDVVRIMTIHKSKGLEFPLVLVGGLGKRFNKDSTNGRVSFHKDIGLGLRYVDPENNSYRKTILQSVIEHKKSKENMAEEIRILYVAFTRAMDKLVLLGTLTNVEEALEAYKLKDEMDQSNAKSYLDFLIPVLDETGIKRSYHNRGEISITKVEADSTKKELKVMINGWAFGTEASKCESGVQPELQNTGDECLQETEQKLNFEEIDRRLSYRYGYQKALGLKSKFTVSELNKLSQDQGQDQEESKGTKQPHQSYAFSGESLAVPKFAQGKKGFTSAERGTIQHKVMEYIDFAKMSKLSGKDALAYCKAFVDQLVEREFLTLEEGQVVNTQKIARFFESDIGQRAGRSKNLKKEVSFNILKELDGEKIIVQGTIDCYFEEDGKYILLDFKSNYVEDAENRYDLDRLANLYRPQLELYKEALETISGVKVEETYLYLFSVNKALRID